MKHLITLIFFATSGSLLCAQPVLGPETLPTPTKSVTYVLADTADVRPGEPGVGVVWDFTQLRPRAEQPDTLQVDIIRPDALPDEVRTLYPTADRAIVNDTLTEVLLQTPQMMRMLGVATPSADVAFAESDPYDVRPVELRYNVEHLDTHSATISPRAFPITVGRHGNHKLIYDGWGQLLLPGEIPIQAARVTMNRITTDTLIIDIDTTIVTTELHRTMWVSTSNDDHYLELETWLISRTLNGMPIPDTTRIKTVRYRRSATTSVMELDQSSTFKVFPHPVSGQQITIEGLEIAPSAARLRDLSGRIITLQSPGSQQASGQAVVAIPSLPDGLYVLELDVRCANGQCTTVRRAVVISR